MDQKNQTRITEILLLGFQNLKYWNILLFMGLFLAFCVSICGNLLIILLVVFTKTLHAPMYMFLLQLSISDVLLTTNIIPNTLSGILSDGKRMSFADCITQFYFFSVSEVTECYILTAMAYDRYLAICNPLRYSSIMSLNLIVKLSVISWVLGFSLTMIVTLNILTLDFCGPHIINDFFCDFDPILQLSCTEISIVRNVMVLLSFFVLVVPLVLTGTSYEYIVQIILQMSSNINKRKVFSTCSSHLTVVCMFYGTLIVMYMLPAKGLSFNASKSISLFYTVVTPLMNPIIYSLRNEDIKDAIMFYTRKKCNWNYCK